jgi:hypothetical protein
MRDGFILDVFFPLGEGAFLSWSEEEFEPSLGREVLERDGMEGVGGGYHSEGR